MEKIKNFVFEDVIFQLIAYHNIVIDEQLESKINGIIDEEYDNFVRPNESWEPDPYIEHVVRRVLESKNEAN